eukprot:393511-Rhodomonas_salina.1
MAGPDIAHPVPRWSSCCSYGCGRLRCYGPTRALRDDAEGTVEEVCAMPSAYAVSGTDVACMCFALCRRDSVYSSEGEGEGPRRKVWCYAMAGTGVARVASSYAVSGTDAAHVATPCAVSGTDGGVVVPDGSMRCGRGGRWASWSWKRGWLGSQRRLCLIHI